MLYWFLIYLYQRKPQTLSRLSLSLALARSMLARCALSKSSSVAMPQYVARKTRQNNDAHAPRELLLSGHEDEEEIIINYRYFSDFDCVFEVYFLSEALLS